ncbi:MAG TPA: transglycosylase domain-containing protein [Mycobacteriales bacterium]|nr:transglycosylase domain-containing protein [Mycobacteriales bacterium]
MVAPGPAAAGARPGSAAARRRRHRRTRLVARSALVLVLALTVGTGTFVAGLLAAPIDLALAPPPSSVLLLADDGRQFATLQPLERHDEVRAEDIPQVMREAIISAEDERFLSHRGVDVLATVRAAFRDLTGGGVQQGGSTLTQQYVKNAYVGNERTALRKVREAALAIRLEQRLSKQEILTDYLNALYLGNGLYGVQAGAKYYFGVPVKDLDLDVRTHKRDPLLALARASMLAGIAPAPSVWNPVKDFTTARIRQQYTLNRMVVAGYASPQQVSDAFHYDVHPLRIRAPEQPTIAPEFADYVKARVKASSAYDEDTFFRGRLRVRTTLDLDLQQAFNEALREVLPDEQDPQAAMIAIDYTTGDVKAMSTLRRVPALRYKDGKLYSKAVTSYGQRLGFNLATAAHRSTGSTIKPFTLAVALQQGMSLSTTRFARNHGSLPNPGGHPNPYVFSNSDVSESGRFTLRRALADSINTVYLPLAVEVGRSKVAALATAAGLDGRPPLSQKSGNLSFGIGGGVEVTPLSEAVAFGTLANNGLRLPTRSFTEIRKGATATDPGEVVQAVPVGKKRKVMPQRVADDVVDAMTDVVRHGTGTRARQPFTVFGKTGTTNGSTDAWFTGCIPKQKICVATWMGYEYQSCDPRGPKPERARLKVEGPCGGMKRLHGFKQVFGGTLPAVAFAKAQENLRRIAAERAARAAGLPVPTVTPSPTRSPRPRATSSTTPATTPPRPTRTPGPTSSASPSPAPSRSLVIVPPSSPPPSPPPTAPP